MFCRSAGAAGDPVDADPSPGQRVQAGRVNVTQHPAPDRTGPCTRVPPGGCPQLSRGPWPPPPLTGCNRSMHRPGPILTMTDYDADDDQDCGCETCNTPWGAQALPLLVLAAQRG